MGSKAKTSVGHLFLLTLHMEIILAVKTIQEVLCAPKKHDRGACMIPSAGALVRRKKGALMRALNELSEHCEIGVIWDENICDQILVAILDKDLTRKLQLTKNLVPILDQSLRQSGSLKRWLFRSAYKAVTAIQEGTHSKYNSQHGKKKEGNGEQCGKCCKVQHSKAQPENSDVVCAEACCQ